MYAGISVIELDTGHPLRYNKVNLLNPFFIVYNPELERTVKKIINRV